MLMKAAVPEVELAEPCALDTFHSTTSDIHSVHVNAC